MIPDPIAEGLKRGWRVQDGSRLDKDLAVETDVAVVGTGAGGGLTAAILARAGLSVTMLEEGPLASSSEFRMREFDAYRRLYQDGAFRQTADGAIGILQGRAVGGGTTVNWTSSFRPPAPVLEVWREKAGLHGWSRADLDPWLDMVERYLSVGPWAVPPNANNDVLARGAAALGVRTSLVPRNVRGCANLGYCGVGCPLNAKQSTLVTAVPDALERKALLLTRARAWRLQIDSGRVAALEVQSLGEDQRPNGRRVTVRARHFVVSAGAIGSPALLMRSQAPDPHRQLGRRTFLHPTVASVGEFRELIEGYSGAPQTVYSDHFLPDPRTDSAVGFKIEAAPVHPLLFAMGLAGVGAPHRMAMQRFAHANILIALLRDGFAEDAPGGRVRLASDGLPQVDYPISRGLWEAARRALLSLAELQFAAGAQRVRPAHEMADDGYDSWAKARAGIQSLPMQPLLASMLSAHVMGGCALSVDAPKGVVGANGVHHQVGNLSVHDGSLFPTSLGTNPQITILAIAARLASGLAQRLTGRPAPVLEPRPA